MWKKLWKKVKGKKKSFSDQSSVKAEEKEQKFSKNITKNHQLVEEIFGKSEDVCTRNFQIGSRGLKAFILYIDGLVQGEVVDRSLLIPLMLELRMTDLEAMRFPDTFACIKDQVLPNRNIKETSSVEAMLDLVLIGYTAIFIDTFDRILLVETQGWERRGVQEPMAEVVLRGPREGFAETHRTNTALLRRKIKNPHLIFEGKEIGKQAKNRVSIAYIKGIVNPKVVEEVRRRLDRIQVDAVLDLGYIEEFMEDSPYSPLPTVFRTERPDVVAGKLLEGRVAVLLEGSPAALTVPTIFVEFLMSSEDYYLRSYIATFNRWLRIAGLVFTLWLPPLYVAVESFHPEMVPTPLIITLASSIEGIPFPVVAEALFVGLLFETLREAGVRMPRPVGQAVSIVGALILGEAAIRAGIASAPMIIVAALTGITIFMIPSLDMALSLIPFRIVLTILAGSMGLFGLMLGTVGTLVHMVSLRSFGVPYLSPLAPSTSRDIFKDVFLRSPWWTMLSRPRTIGWKNLVRQKAYQRPRPREK